MNQNISDIIASKEKQVIIILLGAVIVGCFGLGGMVVALGAGFYEDVISIGVSTAIVMITMVVIAFSLETRIRR